MRINLSKFVAVAVLLVGPCWGCGSSGGIAGRGHWSHGFGLDDVLLARNALESCATVRVRPVLIGDVEEADPLVERVADDLGESLHAQAGLVAGLSRAHAAGPHPHERDLDAGLAQGDLLGRALGKAVLGAAHARRGS